MSSINVSESTSEGRLGGEEEAAIIAEEENSNNSSCTKIGGVDTSCAWGEHGCLSTQAYCCQ